MVMQNTVGKTAGKGLIEQPAAEVTLKLGSNYAMLVGKDRRGRQKKEQKILQNSEVFVIVYFFFKTGRSEKKAEER